MKRILQDFVILILPVLLIIGIAVIPVNAAGKTASFDSARYINGKGLVFLFDVSGDFNKDELKGSIFVNSNTYDLNCVVRDDGKVACTAPMGLSEFVGQTAILRWGNFSFSLEIPPLYLPELIAIDPGPSCEDGCLLAYAGCVEGAFGDLGILAVCESEKTSCISAACSP